MDASRFPAFSGDAVDGTPFLGPRDFAGARTVALVGFGLEHRSAVESWGPFIDGLARSRDDVRGRLFAVLGSNAKMVRKVILAAMRKALTDPQLQASTIIVFTDVAAFCDALGIERKHLAVLVVDPDGGVLWRGEGPFTTAGAAAVTAALA